MEQNSQFTQNTPDKLRLLGIEALNNMFEKKDAKSVLKKGIEILEGDLAIVSSFGADSAILLDFVAKIDKNIEIIFIDTGKHFNETLKYVEILKRFFDLSNIISVQPDKNDLERLDPLGQLYKSDPDSCCALRKTKPLKKILANYAGWVTGRKRFQTLERKILPHFELTYNNKVKINPLAYWSNEDILAYKKQHNLPEHPIYKFGYKSIGCAVCTSIAIDGEDERSGRWRGFNKNECGIHFDFNQDVARKIEEKNLTLYNKNGEFIADLWRVWHEGDNPARAANIYIRSNIFFRFRDEFINNPNPIGLLLEPGDELENIIAYVPNFSSVAINFPKFADGRGYSLARLLREKYEYRGELRAIGDILFDQIVYYWRCGFDCLKISDKATKNLLKKGKKDPMTIFMQPAIKGEERVKTSKRPFLRRAADFSL